MPLFGGKVCPVCGENLKGIVGIDSIKIGNGVQICKVCTSKLNISSSRLACMTPNDIRDYFDFIEKNKKLFESFKPTRIFETKNVKVFCDEKQKLWYYQAKPLEKPSQMFSFSDILSYEYQENGKTVHKSGVGSAILGGTVAGAAGAIVGAAAGRKDSDFITMIAVKIHTDDGYRDIVTLSMIPVLVKVPSGSALHSAYKADAQKVMEALDFMQERA